MDERIVLFNEIVTLSIDKERELLREIEQLKYSCESCYKQNEMLRDNITAGLKREQDLKEKLVRLEIELKKRGV